MVEVAPEPVRRDALPRRAFGFVLSAIRPGWLRILAVVALAGIIQLTGLLQPLSTAITDLRFRFAERAVTGDLLIVEMDERSIRRIGTWPWPREVYAQAIDKLLSLGASEVAIDVDFSSPSAAASDEALAAALARADGAVSLAAFRDASVPDGAIVSPIARFADKAWPACVDVRPDADGRVRSYMRAQSIGGTPCITMPVLLASGAADSDRPFRIDYSIDPRTLDRVSLADLIDGAVGRERVAGRKVLLGATAIELRDFFLVPNWGTIPGVLVQAMAAETLMQDRALSDAPSWLAAAGLALITLLAFAIAGLPALGRRLLTLGIFALGIEALAIVLQLQGTFVLDTAAWQVALALLAGLAVLGEVDVSRFLLALSRAETREVWSMIDKVIEENFTGILFADGTGIIRSASRESAGLLGFAHGAELSGRDLRDVLPPPLLTALEGALEHFQSTGEAPREPVEIDCSPGPDQPRFLEYALTLSIVDRSERGVMRAGKIAICLMFRDVTVRKLALDQVERLARYDTLTGIPNRNLFFEHLQVALKESGPGTLGVAHFDLDGFKSVNDGFGHGVGDDLLKSVAERLGEVVGYAGLFARLGGDEFAVVLRCEAGQAQRILLDLGRRILAAMERPFRIGPYEIGSSVSIGLAQHDGSRNADELMKKADAALYQVKRAGGGDVRFYDAELDARLSERIAMQEELKLALHRHELSVVYQPQIDLSSSRLIGVEALLRWRSPTRGQVSPAEFIPVAEQTGMMTALGEYVLAEACREVATWPSDIKVAVNISSVQFERSDLVGLVERTLSSTGLSASRLALEITESLFIQNADSVSRMLARLRGIGVEIALDDFGTGYSSLGYIRRFPIDKIKIDQSFIQGLPLDIEATAIIRAILSMGDSLHLKVVAEGIETAEQAEMLRFAGCREGQGYLFGRPQSADSICDAFFGDVSLVSAEAFSAT